MTADHSSAEHRNVTLLEMAGRPPENALVECPHCGRTFEGKLLSGETDRHQGFKCPHCRLFVAYDRADEQDRVEPR
jgi:DNA-directed RNA polymerase subunit RPC12/RpoP